MARVCGIGSLFECEMLLELWDMRGRRRPIDERFRSPKGGTLYPTVRLQEFDVVVIHGLKNMLVSSIQELRFVEVIVCNGNDRPNFIDGYVYMIGDLCEMASYLSYSELVRVLKAHGERIPRNAKKAKLLASASLHRCSSCPDIMCSFKPRAAIPEGAVNCFKSRGSGLLTESGFEYVDYVQSAESRWYPASSGYVHCVYALSSLVKTLRSDQACKVLALHGIKTSGCTGQHEIEASVSGHICEGCPEFLAVFRRGDFIPSDTREYNLVDNSESLSHDPITNPSDYILVDYVEIQDVPTPVNPNHVYLDVPLPQLSRFFNKSIAVKAASYHSVQLDHKSRIKSVLRELSSHQCKKCPRCIAIFQIKKAAFKCSSSNESRVDLTDLSPSVAPEKHKTTFPPARMEQEQIETIVSGFCDTFSKEAIEERGCAVCGLLTIDRDLVGLKTVRNLLGVLEVPNVSVLQRKTAVDPVRYRPGPVIDDSCNDVCITCRSALRRGNVPKNALCRGTWVGPVPEELASLRTIEKMLIAKVRHNHCVARVARGHRKLKCNVICFETPVQKVYEALPPPIEDLDEVLAIIFSGPAAPTEQELSRTPFLVRRNVVLKALEWLVKNHPGYCDISISHENLNSYPEDRPPVSVVYKRAASNKNQESVSTFDREEEDGVESGQCPFVVHGLTGEDTSDLTADEMKGIAVKHWDAGNGALRVGQDEAPQSTFKNPLLYANMFPWLFPYGRGAPGSIKMKPDRHKRLLMMYHDKRFQLDEYFTFVAFNHEQITEATRAGFVLVKKPFFKDIVERLASLDMGVFSQLAQRMASGDTVNAATVKSQQERLCFEVLNDLDHINGKVPGSITSKKWMRSELWSLIAAKGAPLWYITLNPADSNHPLSIYYSGNELEFKPSALPSYEDRIRMISRNPAACARFFDHVVKAFVVHVLGCGVETPGLFGKTSAYYGTVEQQGRLSLHLHLLVWIEGAPNPEDARNLITDADSDFSRDFIRYLEECHRGEFFTGTLKDVEAKIASDKSVGCFSEPHTELPSAPFSNRCTEKCGVCEKCASNSSWWEHFRRTTDTIVCMLHKHVCMSTLDGEGKRKKRFDFAGCFDNVYKRCRARFPREVFEHSKVDQGTGSISVRHLESWINAFSAVISYLMRCNTDVTSLRSGTAIKAVILYVSSYITKAALKTHVMFDVVRAVLNRNETYWAGPGENKDKTRTIMTKMVNAMSSRLEIGSPMAAMYLLGLPDHYTDHEFVPLYWQGFVAEANQAWSDRMEVDIPPEKVTIKKKQNKFAFRSIVDDYVNRGSELEDMCVYDWISRCRAQKIPKHFRNKLTDDERDAVSNSDNDSDRMSIDGKEGAPLEPHHTTWKMTRKVPFRSDYHDAAEYYIVCKPVNDKRVPNFIGRSLPRRDRGDSEYYCLTMLALFKPWRSGRDLRLDEDETWSAAFEKYEFRPNHRVVINNLHVKYECIDAKDDYYAKLKNGGPVGPIPLMDEAAFAQMEGVSDLFYAEREKEADDVDRLDQCDEAAISCLGKDQVRRCSIMSKMRSFLGACGWTEPHGKACRHVETEMLFTDSDGFDLNASDWKRRLLTARQAEIDGRRATSSASQSKSKRLGCKEIFSGVDVVNKAFMTRQHWERNRSRVIDSISSEDCLNPEQDRAFRIIAQHASMPESSQLRMYVGGVAGTGKSQVIRSVLEFFRRRGESHRVAVVAPTGKAACLLPGGSTYHYMFGLSTHIGSNQSKVELVRGRLKGVDYIILDEISMLSCRDIERIHRRLSDVRNNSLEPFGGMNIIFAGDFGQLPPVPSHTRGALYSRRAGLSGKKLSAQEEASGKAIWQQVTVVVVLRRNMRQNASSDEDNKFRRALENMRYKSCDLKDIIFLRSLRHSLRYDGNGDAKMPDKFKNVPVITAHHVDIDVFNELGSQRFALETGQTLEHFYSDDYQPLEDEDGKMLGASKARKKNRIRTKVMDDSSVWQDLWKQPPSANTQYVPARISLCKGMPVLIQHNNATELGVTRGQEGTVVDWVAGTGRLGQPVLEVLFIKIKRNADEDVVVEGLRPNIVPLTRTKKTTLASLSDDSLLNISRSQVDVVVSFAMTDYQSQGTTREFNVVHLKKMRDHLAYYTALSRGKSANNTLILDDFDARKISGGDMDISLKQEYRELELLDEITRLRYESKFPANMHLGDDRVTLISEYRKVKGDYYVPKNVHPAIRWGPSDPFLDFTHADIDWKHRGASIKTAVDEPGCDESLRCRKATLSLKRKAEHDPKSCVTSKRPRIIEDAECLLTRPLGPSWHENSCAYDAVAMILRNSWFDDVQSSFVSEFPTINARYCRLIAQGLVASGTRTPYYFDSVRDDFRMALQLSDPVMFPFREYISVNDVLVTLFEHDFTVWRYVMTCTSCGEYEHNQEGVGSNVAHIDVLHETTASSVSEFLSLGSLSSRICNRCRRSLIREVKFSHAPCILSVNLTHVRLTPSRLISVSSEADGRPRSVDYELRGIIYYAMDHFTARFIDRNGDAWYHNGLTSRTMINEGKLGESSLHSRGSSIAISAIYIRKSI